MQKNTFFTFAWLLTNDIFIICLFLLLRQRKNVFFPQMSHKLCSFYQGEYLSYDEKDISSEKDSLANETRAHTSNVRG